MLNVSELFLVIDNFIEVYLVDFGDYKEKMILFF